MVGLIDMEWKGRELIGCCTRFVTSNFDLDHDLDLGFSRSDFENSVYTMGLTLGHSAWQVDRPSNGSDLGGVVILWTPC